MKAVCIYAGIFLSSATLEKGEDKTIVVRQDGHFVGVIYPNEYRLQHAFTSNGKKYYRLERR